MDLTLHLRDVDQCGGIIGGWHKARHDGGCWRALSDRGRFYRRRGGLLGYNALDQWSDHHEKHNEAEQHHHAELDDVHHVVFGELKHSQQARRLGERGDDWRFGKSKVDDFHLIAALLVEVVNL